MQFNKRKTYLKKLANVFPKNRLFLFVYLLLSSNSPTHLNYSVIIISECKLHAIRNNKV